MKCEEAKINIPEFIDGKLDESSRRAMENHIESCESCSEIYTEIKSFLRYTDSLPEIEPPKDMKDEFMLMAELEGTDEKIRSLFVPAWIKAAAMIIVVLGTFAVGYFAGADKTDSQLLMAEMNELKQQVLLAGLRDYSGPQKIEAVYSVASMGETNTNLVDALVYTLNSDKNINVRLAALNVLSGMMTKNEKVKTELINALVIQDNPLIQISLIQILTESGVKEAKENIELISNKDETDQNVKDYAANMIKTII
jgi:hypothetical protein